MKHAAMVDDTGKSPFVDTEPAACVLALPPPFAEMLPLARRRIAPLPVGTSVRYAVADLEHWAIGRRYDQTASGND